MTEKSPYHEEFSCNRLKKVVQITGTKVTLSGISGPVNSQVTHLSCSGMSSCGVLLGSTDCPYQSQA